MTAQVKQAPLDVFTLSSIVAKAYTWWNDKIIIPLIPIYTRDEDDSTIKYFESTLCEIGAQFLKSNMYATIQEGVNMRVSCALFSLQ
jgi:hypothetical protein